MSSPGAGKTTLLERTIKRLSPEIPIGVIEGDIATDHDAKRVEGAGAGWVVQINTGGRCHLEAGMVERALDESADGLELIIIENVGNLVCPAGFDLGEHKRVMLASIPEGVDKPKKYHAMYRASDVLVINKIDLAQYLDAKPDEYARQALEVNPALEVFMVSALKGDGMDAWCGWLKNLASEKRA